MNKLHHEYSVLLSVVFFLVSAVSCGDRENMARLDEADRLLDQYPDSALVIVRSIDTLSLHNPEERGRHSLLLTMALLKTDPSAVSDAIFKPAWKHYGPINEPSRETMLAHFARAALWELQDSGVRALMEYEYVVNHAAGEGKKLYRGLAYVNMASKKLDELDLKSARDLVENSKSNLENVVDTGAFVHALYVSGMIYNVASEYENAKIEFNKGLKLVNHMKDMKDEWFETELNMSLAYVLSCQGRHDEAVARFNKYIDDSSEPLDANYNFAYARSLCALGRVEEAMARCVGARPDSEELQGDYYYTCAKIYEASGNQSGAQEMADSFTRYNNAVIIKIYNENADKVVREVKAKSTLSALVDSMKHTLILLVVAGVLWIGLLIMLYVHISQRKKNRENGRQQQMTLEKKYIGILDGLATHAENERFQKENTQKKLGLANKEIGRLHDVIKEQSEVKDVNIVKLEFILRQHRAKAGVCNECADISKYGSMESYLALRSEYIKEYGDKMRLKEITEEIDGCICGFLSLFVRDGRIRKQDVVLLVYDMCGFGYKTIAELMGVSESNASVMKSRLKKELIKTIPDKYSFVIEHIPMLRKSVNKSK